VALTYLHEGQYLKGAAWLSILESDKKSVFNRNKYLTAIQKAERDLEGEVVGEYWKYAGGAIWDSVTVTKSGQNHHLVYEGYYVPPHFMYYGPNMGEFATNLKIQNSHAVYVQPGTDGGDCTFEFRFDGSVLEIKKTSGTHCGFGHNVSAEGTYYRVGRGQ
jgi:hypothetical protein